MILQRINTKTQTYEIVGVGNGALTIGEIIAITPPTPSGRLLIYKVQEQIPDNVLLKTFQNRALRRYRRKTNRILIHRPDTIIIDDIDIKKITFMAINESITGKRYTNNEFADELCEKVTRANKVHKPIYEDIYTMIQNGLYRAIRQAKKRLD